MIVVTPSEYQQTSQRIAFVRYPTKSTNFILLMRRHEKALSKAGLCKKANSLKYALKKKHKNLLKQSELLE